ncbi:MAG: hypothetical protein QXK39_05340, partial [Nitrososphaerota archaeon]
DIWFKMLSSDEYRVGVTQPLCLITGYFTYVRPRPERSRVGRGTPIALLVSSKYEGALIAPAELTILNHNPLVLENPRKVCEDPYDSGWICDVITNGSLLEAGLRNASEAEKLYAEKTRRHGVVCLKDVPDYSMRVFAETCTTILTEIGDFMNEHLMAGELLHVVTKDPASEVDIIGWASETGHELVDMRREGAILHVLLRKRVAARPSTTQKVRM